MFVFILSVIGIYYSVCVVRTLHRCWTQFCLWFERLKCLLSLFACVVSGLGWVPGFCKRNFLSFKKLRFAGCILFINSWLGVLLIAAINELNLKVFSQFLKLNIWHKDCQNSPQSEQTGTHSSGVWGKKKVIVFRLYIQNFPMESLFKTKTAHIYVSHK